MPSPFPGMDPYLEAHWGDVHARLVIYVCDQLQPLLPGMYRARVEERVVVDFPEADERVIQPDVRVEVRDHSRYKPAEGGGTATAVAEATIAEPVMIPAPALEHEPATETYIEIREARGGNRAVSVVEVLGPTNKLPGPGREAYRQQQLELWHGGVNLLEIDLLRQGRPVIGVAGEQLPEAHRTAYRVSLRRVTRPREIEVYPISLRKPLPVVPVPLGEADPDVPLALQPVIEQCYRNGGYNDIDYTAEAEPPLETDDARWAEELLQARGLRVPVAESTDAGKVL